MIRRRRAEDSIGAELESASWDYSAERDVVWLLAPVSRYFRGFPWEGDKARVETAAPEEAEDTKPDE